MNPNAFVYIVNGTSKAIRHMFKGEDYVAYPGTAFRQRNTAEVARLAAKSDDCPGTLPMFSLQDGHLFIDTMHESLRDGVRMSASFPGEIKKDDLIEIPSDEAEPIPNAPGHDFPAGVPGDDWNIAQLAAWAKDHGQPKLVRSSSSVEVNCVRIWRKFQSRAGMEGMKAKLEEHIAAMNTRLQNTGG